MNKKILYVLAAAALAWTSCSKNSTPVTPPIATGANVYAVGFVSTTDSTDQIVYWKNGTQVALGDGTKPSTPAGIGFIGNDLYVAARRGDDAVIWKNGQMVVLPKTGTVAGAEKIYLSGNDVYLLGYDGSSRVYWKNSVENVLNVGNTIEVTDFAVAGSDVYICGVKSIPNGTGGADYAAVLYKNGVVSTLSTGTRAYAFALSVSGSDVYVAGRDNSNVPASKKDSVSSACYWKNGLQVYLTDGSIESYTNGITVSGSDVYVVGQSGLNSCYWKNTAVTTVDTKSFLNSIAILGSDVYMAGFQSGISNAEQAILFKNSTPTTLAASNSGAEAFQVVIH